jgi:hypothetical protein
MATDLPEGWTKETKTVEVWEWRCPLGEVCGKGYKLMYKKDTKEAAVTAGAWHLADKKKHDNFTWEEAKEKAEEGVIESSREYEQFYNENNEEVEAPTRERWDNHRGGTGGKGGGSKGSGGHGSQHCGGHRGGGGGQGGGGGHRRQLADRSRSRDRDRRGSDHQLDVHRQSGGRDSRPAPRPNEVVISKIELGELIDGVLRAAVAADHCASFCNKAEKAFKDEAAAMFACKHGLERFRRS